MIEKEVKKKTEYLALTIFQVLCQDLKFIILLNPESQFQYYHPHSTDENTQFLFS